MLFGWPYDPDDRPVSSGARVTVVAREQMLQKGVNFSMFVPAELDVFLEGKVTRAAGLSSGMKSGNCFELDTVELFTRLLCWHGRRNHTTTEMWRNGTLVLRKRRQGSPHTGGKPRKITRMSAQKPVAMLMSEWVTDLYRIAKLNLRPTGPIGATGLLQALYFGREFTYHDVLNCSRRRFGVLLWRRAFKTHATLSSHCCN
jgi:hypothetical protein